MDADEHLYASVERDLLSLEMFKLHLTKTCQCKRCHVKMVLSYGANVDTCEELHAA